MTSMAFESTVPEGSSDPEELERLGDHHLATGSYGDALRAYQAGFERRRTAGQVGRQHRADHAYKIGRLFLKLGHFEQARGRCNEALALVVGSEPLARARVVALAGLIECSDGSFELAREKVEQGLALLTEVEESLDRWRIEGSLRRTEGNLLIGLGKAASAVRAYERSHELWQKVSHSEAASPGDLRQYSIALFNLSEAHTFGGDYHAAQPFLEQAFELKTRLEDRWGLAYVHLCRARISLDRRDFGGAAEEAEHGLEHALAINDPKIAARLRFFLGVSLLRQKRNEKADACFTLALTDAQSLGNSPEVALVRVGLSAVCRLGGNLILAGRHVRRAEAMAKEFGDAEVRFALALEKGRLARANGDLAEARECFDRGLEWSRENGNAFRTMEALNEIAELDAMPRSRETSSPSRWLET